MTRQYQICSRCIMDTSDENIIFDETGVCNHCLNYDKNVVKKLLSSSEKKQELTQIVKEIHEIGKEQEYDCLIGLSGGVDSSYLAYCVKDLGLRPLAVHLDNGWNSELAVKNIENIVKTLDIDLFTYVIDWEEFKDLQLAFLKASVIDIEMLTDNAIIVILDRIARERNIKYFLSGTNFATESIMPDTWYFPTKHDSKNIISIHKKYGTIKKLNSYPLFSFPEYIRYTYYSDIKTVPILDYLEYDKALAMQLLKDKLEWKDYGGKHWESKFTHFYQVYILPVKFKVDKRRAHLSSLILSHQLSRLKALEIISEEMYDHGRLQEDIEYVRKKFDLSQIEFNALMMAAPKSHLAYPSYTNYQNKVRKLKHLKSKLFF